MLAALTPGQKIQLVVAVITGIAVVVAAITAGIGVVNERKRTQPVVIAHEDQGRHLLQPGAWGVDAWLSNEGSGPAFNVRFGVEFHGVRYPYRLQPDDPGGGNVQRVIRSNERRPDGTSWPVLIDSVEIYGMAASAGDPDPSRVYWARYENTQGKTWETRNPGDRSAKLNIKRVRFLKWREWREERKRRKAARNGLQWERQVLTELRAASENARAAEGEEASDTN